MLVNRTAATVAAILSIASPSAAASASTTWVQHDGPVVVADQHWEQIEVSEPSVIYDAGQFKMWYTGANEAKCMIGYAESADGITWTKPVDHPVLGWGYGGVAKNACHSNIQKLAGRYWAWFSIDSKAYTDVQNGNLYEATSLDGIHWTPLPKPAVRASKTGWNVFTANSFVVRDHGHWLMFWESFGAGLWRMSTATSTDLVHWQAKTAKPMAGVGFGDTFGGPSIVRENGAWTMYFHAPSPTPMAFAGAWYSQIYEATSRDLVHWKTSPLALVTREQPTWQVDQIADASVVVVNGKRFMFFDGLDNSWPIHSSIGVAIAE